MSTPVISVFNNKGGVGKTSLVYHLSWMYRDLGLTVLAADLDPQANLTAAFLEDDRLELLWPDDRPHAETVSGCIDPLLRGVGDILDHPHVEPVDEGFYLLVGDLALARFEDELSYQWPLCLERQERAFRVISAFWRIIQRGAYQVGAQVAILDLGPNLGAINRAALVASDFVVVPLVPDLFSLQGLKNLGPTLHAWRHGWKERRDRNSALDLELPEGGMKAAGYVILQHAVCHDRPVRAYEKWVRRIPRIYGESVAGTNIEKDISFNNDPNCLGLLKHYRSLMPMAQEARKAIFHLKPADGAIGSHLTVALEAGKDFERLANIIAERCGLSV